MFYVQNFKSKQIKMHLENNFPKKKKLPKMFVKMQSLIYKNKDATSIKAKLIELELSYRFQTWHYDF